MSKLPNYRLLQKIGEGGMAAVYKGHQVSLDRPVAIKVLSRRLSTEPEVLERFKRESLIIARLAHPGIVHVIDRGITPKGMPFFVMEYIEGSDMKALIAVGELDLQRKLDLTIQVCKALGYAHKNGVIHRDIKPGNIIIDEGGNARILDFGIAQLMTASEEDDDRTRTGMVFGTPAYMSPEQQASSTDVTVRSDIYSLGAVIYELFTGKKAVGRFPDPREVVPDIPERLAGAILKCLEQEPSARFETVGQLQEALLHVMQGSHIESDQRKRAARGVSSIEEKFALLDVVKENRYGAVYLYENREDHNLMVLKKRIKTSSGFTEGKLLTNLEHRNIASVLGVSGNQQLYVVAVEYVSGGSLTDRLIVPIPVGEALTISKQILEGVSFAHRNRIVHGNLRPTNVLFDDKGVVKLTDFGLDEHYSNEQGLHNWYNAGGEKKSPKNDIYAAGVIMHQMLTADLPCFDGEELERSHLVAALPTRLQSLLSSMLRKEAGLRIASAEPAIRELEIILAELDDAAQDALSGELTSRDELTVLEVPRQLEPEVESQVPTPTEVPKPTQAPAPQKQGLRPTFLFFVVGILIGAAALHLYQTGDYMAWVKLYEEWLRTLGGKL